MCRICGQPLKEDETVICRRCEIRMQIEDRMREMAPYRDEWDYGTAPETSEEAGS